MDLRHYTRFCLLPGSASADRLDKALAGLFPGHPRAAWKTLIESGAVQVGGATARAARAPGHGAEIAVDFSAMPSRPPDDCEAEDLPLDIVHEDGDIIVVDKPAGMVTHPGAGSRHGTLQAALLFHHPAAAAMPRAGIVHRLDKGTSGLLVAAKHEAARLALIAQFKSRTIRRQYLAIVHGCPPATGLVDRPLAPRAPGKMAVRHGGKEALTRYAVLKQWPAFALLRCWLETGRTHQIRAHLEHAGHPVAGDPDYRRRARALPFRMDRQALHAESLHLVHPGSGPGEFRAEPPADIQAALQALDQPV